MHEPARTVVIRRSEDYRSLIGRAHYVDDHRPAPGRPPALHMLVVRSPYAHARITSIQLDETRAQPGVIAAFSGAELVDGMPTLAVMPVPGLRIPERRPLAVGRVRYVGDPVAVILAESLSLAEDARELVGIDYEALPAVTDPERALEPDAPLLYEEYNSNVAFSHHTGGGNSDATFAQADHIIRLRLVNQRLAPSSLEPRACFFDFDSQRGELSAWMSSQAIYRARDTLATFLGLDPGHIKVQNADVVEIDPETGELQILTYVAVDDCGRVLNHRLVDDQLHGGLAQGIGQALYEEVLYDQDGQLLSGTLMDYALPNARMLPTFLTDFVESPSPYNPLGTKGAGESGCIGAPPAVVNAALDALAPLGITTLDMPLKPEKIWALVQAAHAGTLLQSDPSERSLFANFPSVSGKEE